MAPSTSTTTTYVSITPTTTAIQGTLKDLTQFFGFPVPQLYR